MTSALLVNVSENTYPEDSCLSKARQEDVAVKLRLIELNKFTRTELPVINSSRHTVILVNKKHIYYKTVVLLKLPCI